MAERLGPRDAVIARARDTGDGQNRYWTAIYYGAEYALHLGRDAQAVDALASVVTEPEDRP
ncbi:hypothetical protein [Cryptosporangium sp. NPDC051539]|uniref:hypothetical protein n=1 Tax=Cryptosporangium sp. NPDC051539 TaxID=3363962 RepID=UPI00379F727E